MAKNGYANLRWRLAQSAEIRWWRWYLRPQEPEDYLKRKRAYWNRIMQQTGIRCEPEEAVLDAGCGPAGIFIALPECRVTAIDPLIEEYARLLHFNPQDYPNVQFQAIAIEDLQACAAYQHIFCLNAINHVADLELALSKLQLALRPDGCCWLSVDAHRSKLAQKIFTALPGDILHPHQYTLDQYQELTKRAGFRIERQWRLKPGKLFDCHLLKLKQG